jgi:nitrogen fixation/metabolism regulation signal transduction histidine kinase
MVFRRFRINLIVRVLLLCVTVLLLNLALFRQLYAASVLIAFLIVDQVDSLVSLLETTNRRLTRLFESIRYGDFSIGFASGVKGASFEELNRSFTKVIERFRELSAEKEENYRYLQSVVKHVGIGVMDFRANGDVDLINAAAKKLFDIPRLKNVESLTGVNRELPGMLHAMEPGGSRLIKITVGGDLLQVFVYATELRLRRATLKLVSIQNIKAELEAKEMEAWQTLIRVLTHEIKNSLTPISSLAASVKEMFSDQVKTGKTSDDTTQDIYIALQTIKKRSEGLLLFTDAYRSLTNIKKPEFERFQVAELVERVKNLAGKQIEEAGITLKSAVDPPSLELTSDPQLVEQVLINLVLNAVDAIDEKSGGRIEINAAVDGRNRIIIQVIDNGRGIIEDAKEKIFIPFFSTKKEGSGIGLSISRQIMRLHNGELTAGSTPDGLTVFTMRF